MTALTLFTWSGPMAWGQNLVYNGSFEEYTLCPSYHSQIERAVGWSSLSGSSDYFNACAVNDSMGVPLNQLGFQYAATGHAYAGVATFHAGMTYYRENLWAALTESMVVGVAYDLSMKVSPGGFGSSIHNSARYAASGIGMRFFTEAMPLGVYQDNQPVMWLEEVLLDTAVWTTVSSTFVADSAYRYILIASFWEDVYIDTVLIDTTTLSSAAYAFVDDVCVSAQPGYCDMGVGVPENGRTNVSVQSTLVTDMLTVNLGDAVPLATLQILDASGRQCITRVLRSQVTDVPLYSLAPGYYIVNTHTPTGPAPPIRIVRIAP